MKTTTFELGDRVRLTRKKMEFYREKHPDLANQISGLGTVIPSIMGHSGTRVVLDGETHQGRAWSLLVESIEPLNALDLLVDALGSV